jgi:uncharacterized protein YcbX
VAVEASTDRVTTQPIGTVSRLTRYPVKSMGGEHLDAAEAGSRGLSGDRSWAAYTADGGIGSGKTTRRFRRVDGLLEWSAELDGAVPVIDSPSGERFRADDAAAGTRLSSALGRPLMLRREAEVPHHDESPVHVLTSAVVGVVVLVAGLRLGEAVVLRLGPVMPRCLMVDLPQRDLDRDGRILRTLGEDGDPTFGFQAQVVRGGTVRVGDGAVLG